ncbi:RHS repeat-associated core domain-containing protein [Delftia tsuruhatensis]|uniref:RHS repeat-associated core domain-containing protein n=1 Tax=Delftia tsuruhatensis TaxID=180282 RepID=UPI001F3F05EB|nr:RHS repeat-associated core domain-containing protein [Delftia tsuruhatensis]
MCQQQGHVVWAARLNPWGQVQEEYNPQGIHQEIRLPGQHHDRETGLYYNRHRYYDPEIGAYINQDPIGLMGGRTPTCVQTTRNLGLTFSDCKKYPHPKYSQACSSRRYLIERFLKTSWIYRLRK